MNRVKRFFGLFRTRYFRKVATVYVSVLLILVALYVTINTPLYLFGIFFLVLFTDVFLTMRKL